MATVGYIAWTKSTMHAGTDEENINPCVDSSKVFNLNQSFLAVMTVLRSDNPRQQFYKDIGRLVLIGPSAGDLFSSVNIRSRPNFSGGTVYSWRQSVAM